MRVHLIALPVPEGETALSVFRAGANMLITYYAKEIADAIRAGEIG